MDYEEEKAKNHKERLNLRMQQELTRIGLVRGINTQEEYDEITKKVKESRKKLADIEMKRLKEEKDDKHQGK